MKNWNCLKAKILYGIVLSLGVALVSIPQPLYGQGAAGTIQGTVVDNTGAVIPAANAVATNVETGLQRTVTSNGRGFYVISNLPPGRYSVQISVAGFQQAVFQNVMLTVGQQLTLDAALQLGEITQQIEVSAEAVVISTTSSEVSGVVSPMRVQELPLLGRDFRDLMSLLPGVTPLPSSYTQAGGSGPTRTFRTSMAGGRASASAYYLDGLFLNLWSGLSPAGVTGNQIGIDLVREFRVIVNSYNAEFGRAGSGIINMVSKSGTNSFHGSVFDFFRNDKLNARNFFDVQPDPDIPDKPALRRNQFGFTVGGPVFRNKTFYFVNWEATREREGLSLVQFVPDQNARRGLLPCGASGTPACGPNVPVGTPTALPNNIGTPLASAVMALFPEPNTNTSCGPGCVQSNTPFRGKIREDLGNVRMDHTISEHHSLFGRYTINDGELNLPGVSSSFLQATTNRQHWLSLQEDWIVSPSVVNTFRSGLTRRRAVANTLPSEGISLSPLLVIPTRVEPATFTIANYVRIAPGQRTGGGSSEWTFQFSDDLSLVRGNHTFKLGARIERFEKFILGEELSTDRRATAYGQWRFLTLANFFSGQASELRDSLTATPEGNDRINKQTLSGVYFQDEYRVMRNLTLNLGLRVESMSAPERVPVAYNFVDPFHDSNTSPVFGEYFKQSPVLSPRIGLAWTPRPSDASLVVRGAAGIFYDQSGEGFWSNGININFPYRVITVVPGAAYPNPYPTGNYPPPSEAGGLAFHYQPEVPVPTIYQFNMGLSKAFAQDALQIRAGYVGSQGRHLTAGKQINPFQNSIVNGRRFFNNRTPRINPNYNSDIYLKGVDGNSYYHSFQLSVLSRLGGGSSLETSYTFSKCIDTVSQENTGDIGGVQEQFMYDAFDMRNNRGLCTMHIPHRLSTNLVYALPFRNLQGVTGALLRGWSLSGILQLSNGAPFGPRMEFPRSNSFVASGNSRQERPDQAPGVDRKKIIHPGNPTQYYDPKAFVLQPEGFLGNAGRNTLIGPGLATLDFSVARDFPLRREGMMIQWRSQFFNLFNRVNFGLPEWRIFTNTSGLPNPAAGRITNTSTSSRQVQFALKLVF